VWEVTSSRVRDGFHRGKLLNLSSYVEDPPFYSSMGAPLREREREREREPTARGCQLCQSGPPTLPVGVFGRLPPAPRSIRSSERTGEIVSSAVLGEEHCAPHGGVAAAYGKLTGARALLCHNYSWGPSVRRRWLLPTPGGR